MNQTHESCTAGQFSIGSDVWPGLSKLIEECEEVTQVIGEIIGTHPALDHWDGTNLTLRLQDELADVSAAIVFVKHHCGLDGEAIERRAALKLGMFEQWRDVAAREAGGRVGSPPIGETREDRM